MEIQNFCKEISAKLNTFSKYLSAPLIENKSSKTQLLQTSKNATVHPSDKYAFDERVGSFAEFSWTKPEVSPVECAKHGWTLKQRDVMQCVTCQTLICSSLPISSDFHTYKTFLNLLKEQLISAHKTWCRWKDYPSPDTFYLPPKNLTVPYFNRLQNVVDLLTQMKQTLPVLEIDLLLEKLGITYNVMARLLNKKQDLSNEEITACILCLFGWNNEKDNALKCTLCLRVVSLQNFYILSQSSAYEVQKEKANLIQEKLKKRSLRVNKDKDDMQKAAKKVAAERISAFLLKECQRTRRPLTLDSDVVVKGFEGEGEENGNEDQQRILDEGDKELDMEIESQKYNDNDEEMDIDNVDPVEQTKADEQDILHEISQESNLQVNDSKVSTLESPTKSDLNEESLVTVKRSRCDNVSADESTSEEEVENEDNKSSEEEEEELDDEEDENNEEIKKEDNNEPDKESEDEYVSEEEMGNECEEESEEEASIASEESNQGNLLNAVNISEDEDEDKSQEEDESEEEKGEGEEEEELGEEEGNEEEESDDDIQIVTSECEDKKTKNGKTDSDDSDSSSEESGENEIYVDKMSEGNEGSQSGNNDSGSDEVQTNNHKETQPDKQTSDPYSEVDLYNFDSSSSSDAENNGSVTHKQTSHKRKRSDSSENYDLVMDIEVGMEDKTIVNEGKINSKSTLHLSHKKKLAQIDFKTIETSESSSTSVQEPKIQSALPLNEKNKELSKVTIGRATSSESSTTNNNRDLQEMQVSNNNRDLQEMQVSNNNDIDATNNQLSDVNAEQNSVNSNILSSIDSGSLPLKSSSNKTKDSNSVSPISPLQGTKLDCSASPLKVADGDNLGTTDEQTLSETSTKERSSPLNGGRPDSALNNANIDCQNSTQSSDIDDYEDCAAQLNELKKLKDGDLLFFDPVEQHHWWCGWLAATSGICGKCIPAYQVLPPHIREFMPEHSNAPDESLIQSNKYANNIDGIRLVRNLIDESLY